MREKCNCVWPMFLDTNKPFIIALCRPGYLLADPNEVAKLRYYAPDAVKAELARGGCVNVEDCETVTNSADCIVKCEDKKVTVEFTSLKELSEEARQALSRHIRKGADILVVYHPYPGSSVLLSLRNSVGVAEDKVVVGDIKDLLNICYSDYEKGTIILVSRLNGRVIESGGREFSVLILR